MSSKVICRYGLHGPYDIQYSMMHLAGYKTCWWEDRGLRQLTKHRIALIQAELKAAVHNALCSFDEDEVMPLSLAYVTSNMTLALTEPAAYTGNQLKSDHHLLPNQPPGQSLILRPGTSHSQPFLQPWLPRS